MKNFIILTPTFNDWKSLNKLLIQIDRNVSKIKGKFSVVIVNDASTNKLNLQFKNLKKIKKITLITTSKNLGSQKSICLGLKYLKKTNAKSIIVVIDSDGEDDPRKVYNLISLANKNPKSIITGNRLQRDKNFLYKIFYKLHLLITLMLTGKYIDFGNFSSFNNNNLVQLFIKTDLWLAYSAAVAKNAKSIKSYYIDKRKRYYGKSKVNTFFLLQHSINIITVFNVNVFKNSIIFSLVLFFIGIKTNIFIFYIPTIFLIILNTFINYNKKKMSLFAKNKNLIKNIKNIKN